MKKIIFLLMLLISFVDAHATKINKIIFFGDSLTDDGNAYSLLLHLVPKSPPYFNGRFSNGMTWAEHVGKYYYDKNYTAYKVYAFGGATAVFHLPSSKFISLSTLELQVDKYLIESAFQDRSKILFTIWIGANDYLYDEFTDANAITNKVIDKITWAINTLRYYGAEHFLILNLPDLSRIPKIDDQQSKDALYNLTVLHNQKLNTAIQKIQNFEPNLHINTVNIFDMFTDVMNNPEKYNKKYNINIKNTTSACWQGGFWFNRKMARDTLESQIQAAISANKMNKQEYINAHIASDFILNNPVLAYTYQMSQSFDEGNIPCAKPNEFLFWDALHPSGVAHLILAKIIVKTLDSNNAM